MGYVPEEIENLEEFQGEGCVLGVDHFHQELSSKY